MSELMIESEIKGENGKGICKVIANSADDIYQEIRTFMFDAPNLMDVTFTFDSITIRDFMNSDRTALILGTTTNETHSKCVFTLKKQTEGDK